MRRTLIMVLSLLFCSLAIAANVQAGSLLGMTRTIDITFTMNDGTAYTDGAHLVIDLNTGLVSGTRTGSNSTALFGTVGTLLGSTYRGGAVVLTDTTYDLHVVIQDNPKTWVYYKSDGTVQNSGKYKNGAPPALSPSQEAQLPYSSLETP